MELSVYLTFFVATTIMILLPGPSVMLTVSHSLTHGWRLALVTVAGATLGVAVQLGVALAGMSWFLLQMAEWFEWLRWAGVLYLLYLGFQQWRADVVDAGEELPRTSRHALFWQGFVVTVPNPKSILFLAAFMPQFISLDAPLVPQFIVMVPTFLFITFFFTGLWAVVADRTRNLFSGAKALKTRNRISGTILMGAGLGLALARRG